MNATLRLSFVVTLFSVFSLLGQAGSLDLAFGEDGKVLTNFGSYKSAVNAIAQQTDGKIIAAGSAYNNGDYHQFALARYNDDGTLDTTFGEDGKVTSNYPEIKLSLSSIFLQDDGKIVGAGIIYNNYSNSQFVMVRYASNGELDNTFGINGLVITDHITINSIKMLPDGKILAGGFTFENPNDKDFLLVRYNQDGTPDPTFGVNGRTTSHVGNRDLAYALCVQTDGKIILAGTTHTAGYENNFCLARFDAEGDIDTTFGTNGLKVIDIASNDEISSVMAQSDGKIIFTGWFGDATASSYVVARMLSDGNLDTDFGIGGMVTGSGAGKAKVCQRQNDGKLVFAGSYEIDGSHTIAVTRIGEGGIIDSEFGDEGVVLTPIQTSCKANAILLQADTKILIGGEAGTTGGSYNPDFALVRYHASEALGNEEVTIENSYSVYPNPFTSEINLSSTSHLSETSDIILYDSGGRKIADLLDFNESASGQNSIRIPLPEGLSKGIYILNITEGKKHTTLKIVK